jgi:hypothetical protein
MSRRNDRALDFGSSGTRDSLRRRARLALSICGAVWIFTACLPPPVLAWGRLGHRASARLTESRLTPQARALVRELLEPGESLADASTWADENSRSIPGSAAWHYVNVPIQEPRYSPRFCRDNCVVSRLAEFRRILEDQTAPRRRRRMALRYVVHLLQDAHQPLHVGDRQDRGGNNLQLQFFRDDSTNLHQIWDSGLLRQAYRDEVELSQALTAFAQQSAAAEWSQGGVEDWANESLELARRAYCLPGTDLPLRNGMRLGQDYLEEYLPWAVRRLSQAGVRLADLLNKVAQQPSSARPRAQTPPGRRPGVLLDSGYSRGFEVWSGGAGERGVSPSAFIFVAGFSPPSGSSTPCSRGRWPKIRSKLGKPYFRTIGPLMIERLPDDGMADFPRGRGELRHQTPDAPPTPRS